MGLTPSNMSLREDDEINRIVYVTGLSTRRSDSRHLFSH